MPGQNNSLISALHVIERYALNGKGALVSLYDARTDTLLCDISVKDDAIGKDVAYSHITCHLIKAEDPLQNNLLEMIGIEIELRLSIILGMAPVIEGTLLSSNYELSKDYRVRLIVCRRVDQGEYLSWNIREKNSLPCVLSNTQATHIVTGVKRGVDFVLALRLLRSESREKIDSILSQLVDYFRHYDVPFLSTDDQQIINGLHPTIYTQSDQLRSLANTGNFSDICQAIHRLLFAHCYTVPLFLTLHSVQCLYHEDPSKRNISHKLDPYISKNIEHKIVPVRNKVRYLEHFPLENISLSLSVLMETVHTQLNQVKDMYKSIQQQLAAEVTNLRQGRSVPSLSFDHLNDGKLASIKAKLETLEVAMNNLQTKHSFIMELKANNCKEYINMADLEEPNDDLSALKGKLVSYFNQKKNTYFLCSSDEWKEKDPNEHHKQCQIFFSEYQKNPSLCLVFADFSYCSWKLNAMEMFSSSTLGSSVVPDKINILLVGETGVGKSTFINAFVNYLAFHSMEEAKNNEPIVLIPVSFLLTYGDDFEEKQIEFGQPDSNENHNHSGQSVTQHCQSYIFSIGDHVELRIIDTPGIGDTRGLEQDDQNIEHILSYTNQFSHLNAICFLLKPNTTRLHASFRLCFSELFQFLGPSARDNIIFCFTNTRTTFYTPGNTAPILKKMLSELPDDFRPLFLKENTFCFDSETFRYLSVVRSGHELAIDSYQKQDYEKSWKSSVAESIRLLSYLRHRPKYQMNRWHSIKHAQMIITLLVHPIVETFRYIARNLVINEVINNSLIFEMQAISATQAASFCVNCPWQMTRVGGIYIVENHVHKHRTSSECVTCCCSSIQHLPILHAIEYKLGNTTNTQFYAELENMKNHLLQTSLLFTQFLVSTSNKVENPFIVWFDWFIKQEQELYSRISTSEFNLKLCLSLHNIRNKYLTALKEMTFKDKETKLDIIYSYLDEILKFPVISKQMNTIRESQIQTLKDNEYDVRQRNPNVNMNGLLRRS